MLSLRNPIWLLGLLSAGLYLLQSKLGNFLVAMGFLTVVPPGIVSYLFTLVPLSLLYLVAVWLVVRPGNGSRGMPIVGVILFGLLFRAILVADTPVLSSDLYRYLWDGRVQAAGEINPYLYSPEDEEVAFLRDSAVHPLINRKESRTVYPAGAELLFRAAALSGLDTPVKFKAAGLAAEALTLALLVLILGELHLPESRALIYAWNPLVIFELAQSGHVEFFMIPPVLGFVYFFLRGHLAKAGVALGIATCIKLLPALLLVAVPKPKQLKVLVPLVLVVLLAYLPYLGAGRQILGFLPNYFSDPYEIFNPGLVQKTLFWLTHAISVPLPWSRYVLAAFLALFLFFVARRPENQPADLIPKSYLALSGYLLLIYPAFHPWYLCWMIPLVCLLTPTPPAWLYLSLVLPLSYLKYLEPGGVMPPWVSWVMFLPLYGLLVWESLWLKPVNERSSEWSLVSRTASSTTL